jgi:acetyl esterase
MPLHPGAQNVLDLIAEAGRPPFEQLSVAEARDAYRNSRKALQPEPIDIAEVRDLSIPGPDGEIPLRLYRGRPLDETGPQPVLVFFHGGGWVIGDLESHDTICRELAHRAAITVISVDYRLAPEHRFPAAVVDSVAATGWIADNAAELGVDAARLAVGGDSAGGNLAAAVALDARDNSGPPIRLQVLIYPVTDFDIHTKSYQEMSDNPPVRRDTMIWFMDHYVPRHEDRTDWRAAPLRATDHTNLPPAFVLTAGYDPLCDEGQAYAAALDAARVPCRHVCYDGQIHGFLNMGRVNPQTSEALDEIAAALRDGLVG